MGFRGILKITCVLVSLVSVFCDVNPFYEYYPPTGKSTQKYFYQKPKLFFKAHGFTPVKEESEVFNEVETEILTNKNYGYQDTSRADQYPVYPPSKPQRRTGSILSVLQNFNPFNSIRRQFQLPTEAGQVAVRYFRFFVKMRFYGKLLFLQIISVFVSLAAATAVFYVNDNNLQLKKRVDSLEGRGFDKAIIANCQAVSIKCDPKFGDLKTLDRKFA